MSAAMLVGVEVVAKVTLLLGLGAVLSLALGRATAATRHRVWVGVTLGALLVPMWIELGPTVSVQLLPEVVLPSSQVQGFGDSGAFLLIAVVWSLGALACLARLGIGFISVSRVTGTATSLENQIDWEGILREAKMHAKVARRVRLLQADRVTTPITWGLGVPVVLLPLAADQWSADRRRAVLAHELAHIARYDTVTQFICAVASALYWFHPGIWWASNRLTRERERACDDRVLAGGLRGVEYARHLLELAREASARSSQVVSVAMAEASDLEGRVRAAVDPTRARRSSGRSVVLTASILLIAVVAVAAVKPVPPPASATAIETAQFVGLQLVVGVELLAGRLPGQFRVPAAALLEGGARDGEMICLARGTFPGGKLSPDGTAAAEWRYVRSVGSEAGLTVIEAADQRLPMKAGDVVLVRGHTHLARETAIKLQNYVGGRLIAPAQSQ